MTKRSPSILCLGKFDALHLGHRALIEAAAKQGAVSILQMTEMAETLGRTPLPSLICANERKQVISDWAESLGQQVSLLELPFSKLRSMKPDEFTAYMCDQFHITGFVAGSDFRYGYERSGMVDDLLHFAQRHDLFARIIPPVECEGKRISSTAIRQLIAQGLVVEASKLLGRPYQCCGIVVEGDGRGRTIGVPTANLSCIDSMLPGSGVYAGQAETMDGTRFKAAINIGHLPTIEEGRQQSVEAHLLEFHADLYGQPISLIFSRKLRDEQRFHSLDALVAQIHKDIAEVKAEPSYV